MNKNKNQINKPKKESKESLDLKNYIFISDLKYIFNKIK